MLLILLLFMLVLHKFTNVSERNKILISTLLICLVIMFSFALGTDYMSYQYHYDRFSFNASQGDARIDAGYTILVFLSRSIGLSFHSFASIFRIGILLITVKWIYDNSDDPFQSLILYFAMFYVVWTMSAFRQGITLSLALLMLFGKKDTLSLIKKVVLLFVLSFFHKSALYVLLLLVLQSFNWDKKKHLILFGVSLLVTLLPIELIVHKLDFIPLVSNVTIYINGSFGFFDFASLMRITFFFAVIFFYDRFAEDTYYKKITDTFLFGVSMYFILKFSEITAGRLSIYSFILIIFLLPKVFEYFAKLSLVRIKHVSFVLLSLFTVFFFTKEMNTYRSQVGFKGDMGLYSFRTIYNKDYDEFDNIYSFIAGQQEKMIGLEEDFITNSHEIQSEKFSDNLSYVSMFDSNEKQYGVLSENGAWLIKPSFESKPSIYGSVMVDSKKENLISNSYYTDLSGKTKNQEQLISAVADYLSENQLNSIQREETIEGDFFDLINNPTDFVPFPENIKRSRAVKVTSHKETYHILYLKYYHYDLYVYLDENLEPYSNLVHNKLSKFNSDGLLEASTYHGTVTYNNSGKIIWYR